VVDGGRVIVHVGGGGNGALTAFDAATGAVVWAWKGDGPGYASPVVAEIAGTRQVVTFTETLLVGVAADTGRPVEGALHDRLHAERGDARGPGQPHPLLRARSSGAGAAGGREQGLGLDHAEGLGEPGRGGST
jgi:hypothetical protein